MLQINKVGLQTTVQDLGRRGFQKYGVIVSGVMDPYAHRIANVLVGNPETDATMEITLVGPQLTFLEDCLLSLTGGDLSPLLNGYPIKMWRPIFAKKGCKLSFGKPLSGCRTYLAVAGGIAVPDVMDSKSTYLRAGIGGYDGRALQKEDVVQIGELSQCIRDVIGKLAVAATDSSFFQVDWTLMSQAIPTYKSEAIVRVTEGRQAQLFDKKSRNAFYQEAFQISPDSDRMGYRLKGHQLALTEAKELVSEGIAFGSIQVPPDGQPIILMADRQTTGGYPKIGQVATVDLPKVSQLKPGERIRFEKITLEEAQQALLKERQLIAQLTKSISLKFKEGL
ncbi:biotin-dependent carboxyltransferase family protein [Paenisporosarcina sp.]|uniref:5-oxoprolinase subunit C family protein n=1 Tax=Paenisporosarcina sp. TaxID=1932001 RepID=UPI003C723F4C